MRAQEEGAPPPQCCLCPVSGGALKPAEGDGLWCHVTCMQWVPEVTVGDTGTMEPVLHVRSIVRDRWELMCCFCKCAPPTRRPCPACPCRAAIPALLGCAHAASQGSRRRVHSFRPERTRTRNLSCAEPAAAAVAAGPVLHAGTRHTTGRLGRARAGAPAVRSDPALPLRRQRVGAKIQCTSCYTAYHPLCARIAGLHMEIMDGSEANPDTPVSPRACALCLSAMSGFCQCCLSDAQGLSEAGGKCI